MAGGGRDVPAVRAQLCDPCRGGAFPRGVCCRGAVPAGRARRGRRAARPHRERLQFVRVRDHLHPGTATGVAMSSGIEAQVLQPYKYGFVTDIEADVVPPGLSEDVIRLISGKKGEPEWMLEWRLKAYRNWLKMPEPHWSNVTYGPIDYQGISYYAAPKQRPKLESLDQVDPKLIETFEKLGIPIEERKRLAGVAVDAVFDSGSVATTFRETLAQQGIIFCAISRAVLDHPELVPGRRGRPRRDLQLRDQARGVPRQELEDLVDPGRDRLSDHLEIPRLHPPGRQLDRRVLLGGRDQPAPAGRHGHEDDPPGEEHALDHRVQGHLGGPRGEHPPRSGKDSPGGRTRPQLPAGRFDADRRQVGRP